LADIGRALPFLLNVTFARPNLALTARTRLLISAAMEGKDASPSMISEKSPEEKPPPKQKALWRRFRLFWAATISQRGSEARLS
jgi:hypothetical protein